MRIALTIALILLICGAGSILYNQRIIINNQATIAHMVLDACNYEGAYEDITEDTELVAITQSHNNSHDNLVRSTLFVF